MPQFTVTERLHGADEGKLQFLEAFSTKAGAKWLRREWIRKRMQEPVFPVEVSFERYRRRLYREIEVWRKV